MMYKTATTAERLLGAGVAAILFGCMYHIANYHFPPHVATPGHRHFIWNPENYQDPKAINKDHVVVPPKSEE